MDDIEFYPVATSPAGMTLPFSEAVRVGSMLYLSGAIGTGPDGRLVAGGVEAETRQVLANLRAVLERHGSSLDRVVKTTVMLLDIADWGAVNRVYLEFFTGSLPARSALGTSGLALGARVEIECVATVEPVASHRPASLSRG